MKDKICKIEITKDSYYHLIINGEEMPEVYNEREIMLAIGRLIKVWSNKE